MQATPWGLSPHSHSLFEKLRKNGNLNLTIPEWKEEYTRLTSRQTAAECLDKIRELLPDMDVPVSPKILPKKVREVAKIPDPPECSLHTEDSLFIFRQGTALATGTQTDYKRPYLDRRGTEQTGMCQHRMCTGQIPGFRDGAFIQTETGTYAMKGFPYSERKRKELIPEMYWANRHIWKASLLKTSETNSSN